MIHSLDGEKLKLSLWDTPKFNGSPLARVPAYAGVDIVLVCFAINDGDWTEFVDEMV